MKTECKSESSKLPDYNKNCSVMKDTSLHSPKTDSRRLSSRTPRGTRKRIPLSLPKSPPRADSRRLSSRTPRGTRKRIPLSLPKSPLRADIMRLSSPTHGSLPKGGKKQVTLSSLRAPEGRRIAKLRNRSGRGLRVRMSKANRSKSETIQERINQLNKMINLKRIKKGKCRDETAQNNENGKRNDDPETDKVSHSLWDRIVGGICFSDDNIMISSSDIEKLEEDWIEKLGQKVESKLYIGCGPGEREVELQYSFDASSGILSCPSSSSSQDTNGSLASTNIDNGSFAEIKDESLVLQRAKNKMSAEESSKSQSVSKSCSNIRDQRNLKRNTGLKISTKPEIRETTEYSIDEVRDSHESNEKYGTHEKYKLSEGYFTRNNKPEIRETSEHFIDEVRGSHESSNEKYGAHEKYELSEECFTRNSRSSAEVFLKPEIGHNSPVGKNIDGVHYRLRKGLPQPTFIKCNEKKRGSKSQLCADSLDILRKLHSRDARELQESKVINSCSR